MLQIGRYSPVFSQTGRCRPSVKECDTGHLRANCRGRKGRMQHFLAGWFFFFCRFTLIRSDKERGTGRSIWQKKKNATMQRHSKKNANPASFIKDSLQCCTLHLKYFRHIAKPIAILQDKRRMQQCKGTQRRMQFLHPSPRTICNVAFFIWVLPTTKSYLPSS